jgi:hypothetical protein
MSGIDWHALRPPSPWPVEGESIETSITRIEKVDGRYGETCQVELNNDGRKRFTPISLWRALYKAQPQLGERIRISRLSTTDWRVEKIPTSPVPQPSVVYTDGPQW